MLRPKNNLSMTEFENIYIVLGAKLSELFKEYKKTKSFKYLKR